MLLEPTPAPLASPVEVIVTAATLDEVQVAELVRFWVVPSLKVPVAVNWSVVPLDIAALIGLMVMFCRTTLPLKSTPETDEVLILTF
jgi:hypothetical protein